MRNKWPKHCSRPGLFHISPLQRTFRFCEIDASAPISESQIWSYFANCKKDDLLSRSAAYFVVHIHVLSWSSVLRIPSVSEAVIVSLQPHYSSQNLNILRVDSAFESATHTCGPVYFLTTPLRLCSVQSTSNMINNKIKQALHLAYLLTRGPFVYLPSVEDRA